MAARTLLVPMQVGDTEILVEVALAPGSENTSHVNRAQDVLMDAFARAQHAIIAIASATVSTINEVRRRAVRPDEFEVKFGVKFSANGSVVLASVAGEASLEVKLKYTITGSPGQAE